MLKRILCYSKVVLSSDEMLSEFTQKLSDLLNGLEVNVGVQLSEGGDDGLREFLIN
jgi:hypothetical protein